MKIGKEIQNSLQEAIAYTKGDCGKAKKRTVCIEPVKEYSAEDVKRIRKDTSFSQALFAAYLGVSSKTVEAWESGRNHPCGASGRLLYMIEQNPKIINEYPFVYYSNK